MRTSSIVEMLIQLMSPEDPPCALSQLEIVVTVQAMKLN